MNFCIAGRCEGTSSTSAASAGIAADSECSRNSTGSGSAAVGAGGKVRPAGAVRACLRQHLQQHRQRGLHRRDDAGAGGRHRRRIGIVGDLENRGRAVEDRGMAFDMEGEHRRADHDDEVVAAQRIGKLARRGVQEAGELRMPFRERAARRERADPDCGLRFLRDLHHQIDRAGAVDAGADDEGRVLARGKRRDQRLHRVRVGADLAADLARGQGLRGMGPVVDRHRDEGRPAGRLHRRVIGARDRGRHVLGAAPARRCI